MKIFQILVFCSIVGIILGSCATKKLQKIEPEICKNITEASYKAIHKEKVEQVLPLDTVKKYKIVLTPEWKISTKYGEVTCPTYTLKEVLEDTQDFPFVDAIISEDEVAATMFATVKKTTHRYIKTYNGQIDLPTEDQEYVDIDTYAVEPQEVLYNQYGLLNSNSSVVQTDYIINSAKYEDTISKLNIININGKQYRDGDIVKMNNLYYCLKVSANNFILYYFNNNIGVATSQVKLELEQEFTTTTPDIVGNKYLNEYMYPAKRDLTLEDVKAFQPW